MMENKAKPMKVGGISAAYSIDICYNFCQA